MIQSYGFSVGSLVAPVWPGTVGDSAMGDQAAREKFLSAVKMACRIAKIFNEHGVRKYGVIRIDSAEFGVEKWRADAKANTAKIVETFKEAAKIAADHGERLAAEGEICWAGMHTWKDMLDVLEGVGMPKALGFQADLAHTYLYLMGYNAPEYALLHEGYTERRVLCGLRKDDRQAAALDDRFPRRSKRWPSPRCGRSRQDRQALSRRTIRMASWTSFVARRYWLKDAEQRGIKHICWDGCMFSECQRWKPLHLEHDLGHDDPSRASAV